MKYRIIRERKYNYKCEFYYRGEYLNQHEKWVEVPESTSKYKEYTEKIIDRHNHLMTVPPIIEEYIPKDPV